MADNGDTGAGVTIAFSGGTNSGFSGNFTEISGTTESRASIPDHHLESTAMTKMPGDLPDYGSFTGNFYWDQSFSTFPTTNTTPDTVTVTFPLKSGESSNGTLAGTANVVSVEGPSSSVGTIMAGTMTIEWDAKTGPTYTAGS